MNKYSVEIETSKPYDTKMALENAGIPSVGPAMAGFVDSPDSWTTSDHITAVLGAPDARAAVTRIREVVGPSATIGEPKPYD